MTNPTTSEEDPMSASVKTAVVTGAGRGLGRAIAAALVAQGTHVVGLARTESDLLEVRGELGDGFTPLAADATDEALARRVIREYRPNLLVLNAGAVPPVGPVHEQTWESFSRNWLVDTRHVFGWTRAALLEPLEPGSVVVSMSSGAAIGGSPLSGGYASAKAAVRYLRDYAGEESQRAGLGIRFVALIPMMTPATAVGSAGVDAYSARQGVDRDTFVANMQPVPTPDLVAKAVLDVVANPDSAAEYRIDGNGSHPVQR
jgi:NAD(P)-dependent dehydrogenase (short-subunit alcohol dehydrogenase family)